MTRPPETTFTGPLCAVCKHTTIPISDITVWPDGDSFIGSYTHCGQEARFTHPTPMSFWLDLGAKEGK